MLYKGQRIAANNNLQAGAGMLMKNEKAELSCALNMNFAFRRKVFACLLLFVLPAAMVVGGSVFAAKRTTDQEIFDELNRIVAKQAVAWNAGDLTEFMVPYWNDERLTFSSGGETQRGWERTFNRYKVKYPDRATMGQLTFDHLESQVLGENAVLMLGTWQLQRDKPIGGNFSLVWKQFDGKWLIVHDHSSSKTP